MAARKLVDSPQFASGGDERLDIHFALTKQLSQTDPASLRNDDGRARTDFDAWPLGIQQLGTMDFPSDPLVGADEHAGAAARQRQESIPAPNDDATANAASFDEDGFASVPTRLNLVHPNAIHEPGNDSLQLFNH
jgi:hypothetical protein